jgi:hypothetical protein
VKSTRVEFRFLQLIVSPVSGDKLTLALVHWNGETLRVASSLEPLRTIQSARQKTTIRRTVKEWLEALRSTEPTAAASPPDSPRATVGLAQLFPVREGLGGALFWSPVSGGKTNSPARHFEELRAHLHLSDPPERRRRVSVRELYEGIKRVGSELAKQNPDQVKLDFETEHLHTYRSPLSWKNGVWHHTMPVSMDVGDEDDLTGEVERVAGRLRTSFEPGTVPVVVAMLPGDRELDEAAQQEIHVLTRLLAEAHGRLVQVRPGQDDLGELAALVRHDISELH